MNWLYYLLESNLYLIIFYLVYFVLFRKETYYQVNRAYLLISPLIAFTMPVLQLGMLKPDQPHLQNVGYTIVQSPVFVQSAPVITKSHWTTDQYLLATYTLIAGIMLVLFIFRIAQLIRLSRINKATTYDDFKLIELPNGHDAFSFFNYLFVGDDQARSAIVIRHEMIHIKQGHSWDIIYFEVLKIVNWFNPAIYLFQSSTKQVHEFIADEQTASGADVSSYADFLLANAYGIHSNTLTNTFFNKNLLKKRIMMLHQKRSGTSARLKFLALLPLLAGLLSISTLAFAKSYGWIDIAPAHADEARNVNKTVKESNASTISDSKFSGGIPVLSKGSPGYIIDPGSYNGKGLSDMSLKFYKRGYKMDFDEYKDDHKNAILKLSLRKLESEPNTGVSATFKVNELKRNGYVIFIGADASKNTLFIHSEKITFPKPKSVQKGGRKNDTINKAEIGKVIRKQKDSIIKGKITSVNKQIDPTIKGEIKKTIKSQVNQQPSNKFPPPSVTSPGFQSLSTYLSKHIRYPAAYFEQEIVDNVVVDFTVGANHKVSGSKVTNDAKQLFAEEVSRQLNSYPDTLNVAPGVYFFLIQFNLLNDGRNPTKSWLPSDKYLRLSYKPNYAGNIEISGFVRNK